MNDLEETYAALQIILARLETLANILIPGGPQARYHEIVFQLLAQRWARWRPW